ncbi:MAG: hypothetical protein Tsb009_00070 [Planctomycetaceae bacterium]
MSRWRTITLLVLLLAPVLLFVGVGAWSLWETGRLFALWFTLPIGWGLAYWFARRWRQKLVPLEAPNLKPPLHWTPRDKAAWKIVESRLETVDQQDPEEFTKVQVYLDTARDLSEEIARHYHPKASDPFGALTIPEILAAAQLALEDLAQVYDQYIPGGDFITVDNWRSLSKLPKHYKTFSNLATAVSAIFSPVAAAGRFVASKTVMAPVTKALRSNVLSWFYKSFLQRVGFYAIEMNSGRLRGGAKKFREHSERLAKSQEKPWDWNADATVDTESADQPGEVEPGEPSAGHRDESASQGEEKHRSEICLCLVGQTGSGKTSLATVLHQNRSVETSPFPKTDNVIVHRFPPTETGESLMILDTPGYAAAENEQLIEQDLARVLPHADLILLILDVTNSARAADIRFLEQLGDWYAEHPQLKPPPVLAVATHVDLLRPVMEWEPPYDVRNPSKPKEMTIHEAISHLRSEFDDQVAGVVAICTDVENERVWGIPEELEPAIASLFDEARAGSMLRALHGELKSGKLSKVIDQVVNVSRALRGK